MSRLWRLEATSSARTKRLDEALSDAEAAIRVAPSSTRWLPPPVPRLVPEERLRQGARRCERGDPARPQERRGVRSCAGQAFQYKKEWAKAISDYDEAIRLDPKSAEALVRRADVHASRGNFPKALADFDAAVRLDPKDDAVLASRGGCLRPAGDLRQGSRRPGRGDPARSQEVRMPTWSGPAATICKGNTTAPSPTRTRRSGSIRRMLMRLLCRATCYHAKQDFAKALVDLDEAIKLNPRHAVALARRADLLMASGETEKALADLNRSIQLDPEEPRGSPLAGEIALHQGPVRQGTRGLE